MKSIKTHCIINAPIEKVWDTLMDFESHSKWNPFIKEINGKPEVGTTLTVTITTPDGKKMTFKPVVLSHIPYNEFRWKGKLGIRGIFDGEHYFNLERIDQNTTAIHQGEHFSGVLVGFLAGVLNQTKIGFERMNKALKIESESRHTQS
ncbi:SRPBCC domain-containing protein [Flavobacterium sedimenticola]|uniref:SRPBCC domain-containing protein n=1 Tax=Flavobacterium sedimenticola TaxID=3043286 RepID=A0ABT6XSU1_9FLAO|nr:SRPBCC domain-containing protein [Flavobacterium sedimenticola]MDI9258175.1 SRPBCC domain-containing protein [Flavobacterium sedimenticola]